jgi:hypothetical protein
VFYVLLSERREVSSLHVQAPVDLSACVDHIKSYSLALSVAIQPQNQLVDAFNLCLHIFDYFFVILDRDLLQAD